MEYEPAIFTTSPVLTYSVIFSTVDLSRSRFANGSWIPHGVYISVPMWIICFMIAATTDSASPLMRENAFSSAVLVLAEAA